MTKRCPRCNHPTKPDTESCLACARPLPPGLWPSIKPKPGKRRKAKRPRKGSVNYDTDPIA